MKLTDKQILINLPYNAYLIECIAKDEKLRKGFRLALEEQAKEIFNKLDKLPTNDNLCNMCSLDLYECECYQKIKLLYTKANRKQV